MKKALIVANLGGFASFLISDIDILLKKGYKITYAANCNVFPWEDTKKELLKRKVKITNIDFDIDKIISIKNIKAYFQLKKHIKSEKYKIIHCHTPIIGVMTRLAARKLRKRKKCKVIYTTHGLPYTIDTKLLKRKIYFFIEKIASKYTDAFITMNKYDYSEAKKMKCKNVCFINGVGIDCNYFKKSKCDVEKKKKELNVPLDKIVILSVGTISNRKNHQIIIRALSLLNNRDDYVYVIVGGFENLNLKEKLEKMSLNLKVNLIMTGFRKDVNEINKLAMIGALPSLREGLCLSGIQMMASGIPIIGSNVKGVNDYVIDDKTGILCNANNPEDFSKAIVKLSDNKIREKMKDNCIKTAEMYDMKVSYQQREKIYNQMLE